MTLAVLAEILTLSRHPQQLRERLPTMRLLSRPTETILKQVETLLPAISKSMAPRYRVSVEPCHSQIGSGSLPIETLPSAALCITPNSGEDADTRELADRLRQLPTPVIGRLHKGALWMDLRCLEPNQEAGFLEQLATLLQ